MGVKQVYVNEKQTLFLNHTAKRKTFVGGRGSGKTTTLGFESYLCYEHLPRAKFFLAGLTYNQILNKTLPAMEDAWKSLGLLPYDHRLRAGHYVIGRRPPDYWPIPFHAPKKYDTVISFINGFAIEMLSLDRADTARGGSFDGGFCDESGLIKHEVISKVLQPSIRGNIHRFSHYMHQKLCDFTSVPWMASGQWVFETQEHAKTYPDQFHFVESTAYDNIHVLGERYIQNLKLQLPDLDFRVEVMNERINKLPNCFYPAFQEGRHLYYESFTYDYDKLTGLTHVSHSDVNAKKPLDVSFDFNADFTCCIIGQEHGMEYRIVNALYVKHSDTNLVDALLDKLLDTYKDHPTQRINIYGDRNGNERSAGSNQTFYEQIMDKLRKHGWSWTMNVINSYPSHQLKHRVLNAILAETNTRLPRVRINQNTCKFLILSIQNSPIKTDWKKDKKDESRPIDQERATHFSDTFDYLIYRRYAKLLGLSLGGATKVRFLN
ncbi:hypothetical protein [Xanthocytophaga flava]|uniref:hypothetical protein n=1 Tax=Xanthocytophaga flava TaxID=3048013 RepID=UPI0028D6F41F|nr:hypothetical protein [Xanthocytophaga flavus]MDJ1468163.1 hypothetical protein [Xanthocytophaga flavus]